MARLTPPWDAKTVEALNAYQDEAPMHPFTCPHRDQGHTTANRRDLGVLLATPDGWVCRNCNYTQKWAWPWMADTSWWRAPEDLTDRDGTRWVHDPVADTYQAISPDGDASVPMPALVFGSIYPELYAQFHPDDWVFQEFVRRGRAAQQAVDEAIEAERDEE